MDDLDRASEIESLERSAALSRHASRPRVVQLCEMCEEAPAHVTDKGTHWRFCAPCAEEHLRGGV